MFSSYFVLAAYSLPTPQGKKQPTCKTSIRPSSLFCSSLMSFTSQGVSSPHTTLYYFCCQLIQSQLGIVDSEINPNISRQVIFRIELQYGDIKWVIRRSLYEFYKLHLKLSAKRYPNLPKFPNQVTNDKPTPIEYDRLHDLTQWPILTLFLFCFFYLFFCIVGFLGAVNSQSWSLYGR
jgi:hypothetical protein